MSQVLRRCRALVCSVSVFFYLAVFVNGGCDSSFNLSTFSYNNIHFISHSWLDPEKRIHMAPGARHTNSTNFTAPQNSLGMGQALYKDSLNLVDPVSKAPTSFSTSFAFTMTSGRKSTAKDGVAFIVIPVEEAVETIPGGKEIVGRNSDVISSTKWNLLAVQLHRLDTEGDFQLGGDKTNFSGTSSATTNVDDYLTDGSIAIVWIDYYSTTTQLEVRVSNTTTKPEATVITEKLDLRGMFLEKMFIGFSTPAWVRIHWWNFSSACPMESNIPRDISTSTESRGDKTFFPFSMLAGKNTDSKEFIITVSCVLAVALVLLLLLIYAIVRICRVIKERRKLVQGPENGGDLGTRIFAYRDLSIATQGFNSNALLGRGGFGSVYKGTLEGGALVAVKRIEPNNGKNGAGERQFIAEVASIGRLRHRNLVLLQGWCHEKGELLLVYDFMPNGSLDRLLFGKQRSVFPWESRFNIVQGVAAALAYLHGGWEKQVVHRDVKASNVLLDHNYQPRLGDFGLARMIDHNKAPLSTTVAGTYGYLAPEITYTGKATDKTDVYSFGALALEVACGRRPIERKLPPDEISLVDWVWGLHSRGELLNAVDSRMQRGTFDAIQVATVLSLGLLCSHPDPTARPHMRQVVQILRGEFGCPPVPVTKPNVIQPNSSAHPKGQPLTNNKSQVADCSSSLLNSGRSVSTSDSSTSDSSQSPLHHGPSSHVPAQDNSR